MAVASYIQALLPAPFDTGGGGIRDWRWNNTSPVGTPVNNLTYSFMDSVPAHANPSDGNGFVPFTDAQKAAVRSVLDLYEGISRITFLENPDGETGQILFGANTQGSAGYAYFPDLFFDAVGDLGGDVWINKNLESNFDFAPGGHGLATLIHEVGHALGLEHPGNYSGGQSPHLPAATDSAQYSVMSYIEHPEALWREITSTPGSYSSVTYNIQPSTLMLYDIAAIQHLYGANMTTRTGNDTYTFETDEPFLQCIWDAGGTDTISVLNFDQGCTINLNAGQFSSIRIFPAPPPFGPDEDYDGRYEGTNNLSIAFGAKIERAVGGSGGDKLIGNSQNNTLTGNGGNDLLDGGGGKDKLDGGIGKDILRGGGGNDTLTWQPSDSKVDGGSGSGDALKLIDGNSLDLVAITDQKKILGIETIDMNGGGDNVLTLARSDVLDISSSTETLKILGDAGDTVDLTGFTRGALKNGFVTWKSGTAILKIEDDIVNVG